MPSADNFVTTSLTPRIFVYGPAKSQKTWWALRAAEFGWRVLYFDFEHSGSIVKQLPADALKRIYMLEVNDGPSDAFASVFATTALRSFDFYYNEATRQVSLRPAPGMVHIDMRNFGRDTVVVFDSYTALAVSVARRYAFENGIDLADAQKPEWEGYRWCGALLTWMLTQMQIFPCPIIVIGHTTQYEKYKQIRDSQGKPRQGPLEWSRRQPISSSNPHGMSIAAKFEDVLYMYKQGHMTYIETKGDQYADAGSRIVPPGRYTWDELTFAALAKMAGIEPPQAVTSFNFEPAPVAAQQPSQPKVIQGKSVTEQASVGHRSILLSRRA